MNNYRIRTIPSRNPVVKIGLYCTHKRFVGESEYREFGDVIFAILINDPSILNNRLGYVNTYQFKVGSSFKRIINRLDHTQLNFYLKKILNDCFSTSQQNPSLLGDFMNYWFIIGSRGNRKILEIPLSVLWLKRDLKYFRYYNELNYSFKAFTHGWSVFVNNMFLVTGIEISKVLPYSKPNLKKLLTRLLTFGVHQNVNSIHTDGGEFEFWDF